MRTAFSDALFQLASQDPRLLLLTGDHGYTLFDPLRSQYPQQYMNAGIAEQNLVGMAAGLARGGFRPIVYGLSAFIPIRVLEQIKIDVAHDNLPVIFIGDGAGFVYSHLGTSHQSAEDIACLRALPNIAIFSPADRHETTACFRLAYALKKPVYIRMGKADLGDVHQSPPDAPLGSLLPLKPGRPGAIAILATGSMVLTALKIAETAYPEAAVYSVPFIKPIDQQQVTAICQRSSTIFVLEEHSVHGGLGSLIAEIASASHPVRLYRIGIKDRFSEKCGSYAYLLGEHGLDQAAITREIAACLAANR